MSLKKALLISTLHLALFSQELENILDDLNQYSDKTHLNIDYKPTAMTVLYSQDLEALGINTLSEALDFIPGIQTFSGTSTSSIVSIRGYSQPFSGIYEKIGYFINGVSLGANYYENFPISLIDRIEISKGATLGLYNQNSFIASINIITKSTLENVNNVAIQTGSFDKRATSLALNEKIGSFNMGLDFYYLKDNKKVDAPSAILTTEAFGTTFDRKQESLEAKEDINFGLSLKNDNFEFSTRYVKNHKQNNYGFTNLLDFNDEGYIENKNFTSELKYVSDISENNKFETKLGILQNNAKLNTYFYKIEPNNLGFYNPHFEIDYIKRSTYLSLLIKNSSFDKHKIEYGILGSIASIPQNKFYTNIDNNTYEFAKSKEMIKYPFFYDTKKKTNYTYYFNDMYEFSDKLNLSFNVKIDDFESFKRATNFKIGTIYSDDNINIYKFILSKSSRVPSSTESSMIGKMSIYSNDNLKAEDINSAEFMYIYGQNSDKFKLNLYYSIYKNSIDVKKYSDNNYRYINKNEDETNYGVEIEYSKIFENRSKLLLNGSYNRFNYKNKDYNFFDIDTPVASKITANLAYIYPINSKFTISPSIRYYGTKKLIYNDSISEVSLFDLTLAYNFSKSSKLSFGAKNILDKDYYSYGYQTKDEKMLREGRTWFASFSYDF